MCVLKDSRTMTAADGRPVCVNLAGNSAMAKAGSGDVLAGVITGLAAQGMSAFGQRLTRRIPSRCAGDAARDEKGGYSVLARDLIAGLGTCMRDASES